jgi:hypothetical protein
MTTCCMVRPLAMVNTPSIGNISCVCMPFLFLDSHLNCACSALDLKTCSVGEHLSSELKHAFEIFGSEKSFICIAATASEQQSWISSIKECCASVAPAGKQDAVAPLWTPDHASTTCCVCSKTFNFMRYVLSELFRLFVAF